MTNELSRVYLNTGIPMPQKRWHKIDSRNKSRVANAISGAYVPILLDILETINTPKAVAVAICLRNLDDVATECLKLVLECNPANYRTAYSYQLDAQAAALLKKSRMFKKRYDQTDHLAFYLLSEQKARSQSTMIDTLSTPFEAMSYINRASEIIRSIIGDIPHKIVGRAGPGSTFDRRGNEATPTGKLQYEPECTPLAARAVEFVMADRLYHKAAIEYHRTKSSLLFSRGVVRKALNDRTYTKIVPGDRFCLVEKDIFKPRAMCPQPAGNMLVQLGLADILEGRFKRWSGIDLRTTDKLHQLLVEHCSDLYGTIDLSDASDSISLSILRLLLPEKWYNAIRSITCRQTRVGDKWYPNSKAFAQGCGVTFILETIIFYALCYSAIERNVLDPKACLSVYGDDIIVPIHQTSSVIKVLESCGFSVNTRKSYGFDSVFKESCGMDTFNGTPVRPIFFKHFDPTIQGLCILINSTNHALTRLGLDSIRVNHRLRVVLNKCNVSPPLVPFSFGMDEGIHSTDGHLTKMYANVAYIKVLQYKQAERKLDEFLSLTSVGSGYSRVNEICRPVQCVGVRSRYRAFQH